MQIYRCLLACAVALAALTANVAHADDAEEAQAMFAAGIAALEQGDNGAARAAFDRSLELHPTSAAAFNLAGVLTDLGRPAAAYALYDELGRDVYGTLANEQQTEVARLIAEVETLVARIEVRVVAPGAVTVTIGARQGVATEGSPFVVAVEPGEHIVRGAFEGAPSVENTVSVSAGGLGRTLLRLELSRQPREHQDPAAEPHDIALGLTDPETATDDDGGVGPWLWVVLGLAVLGGATLALVLLTGDSTDEAGTVLPATGTLVAF